ncbi:uncharacterized protein PFL1_05737 [Pseudozyma flocculosa PF-1]|uniref:Related to IST2 - Plasma membrane protein that may be involved in osmotolerance n=2 Tax=Pseudozyma flocculosa TaxID=84751 RepID=A0A5C3FA04_9BASI|nr:uncharacterized protein PFL1_05737 [Pseudozyma flocculosa PF-1]EPQ26758.1 hypothetical protein PFL1_05737 [Pseudozyma flocculosa PF-1]SPO40916.1 related to IST2 - Plasma membrane protein that may be involved in osmotolerance [Pseudozyma flocculosa]
MNGHRETTAAAPAGAPPPPPPKDGTSSSSTTGVLSDRLVPAISGAATSLTETASAATASVKSGLSPQAQAATSHQRASPPPPQQPVPHSRADSQLADYVLVFQAIAKKHIRSKTKVQATERAEVTDEYDRLVARIRHTGLKLTSREGAKGSGQVLLFVKADPALLNSLARQESLTDYLHGVLSVEPPPQRSSSLAAGASSASSGLQQRPPLAVTPASRVRFVHSLLTLPTLGSKAISDAAGSDGDSQVPSGAGLRVGLPDFPRLVDMSAIHDPIYNSAWVQRWSHTAPTAVLSGIGLEDLDSVREHFGEDVGLYFGFLNFYFQALAPLALWGTAFWAFGRPYSPLYSFGLVAWACLTVEMWRMKERKLSVRWGTVGVDRVERRRDDFQPRTKRVDPATGEQEEVFEWWRRELRVVATLPVMLVFASLLAATMTLMFVVEIFVGHLYHGPLKQAVPFIPTALFVVAVPQIMAAWQATAASLTGWENHYSSRSHDYSLTLKRFALQGMVAYGALFLSAFVYIPFGEAIMHEVVERGFFRDSIEMAVREGKLPKGGIDFHVNPDRMHTQLFAVSVTSQAIGAFTELVLPLLMRKAQEWKRERDARRAEGAGGEKSASSSSSPGASDPEAKFVRRVQKELELPPYDLFGDYAEMATQFGYITLWSVIWPLSPVMGFVNNFFELRADAAKICLNQRRPIPVRAESVGPWLEVLGFIAWLSALSNSALVYLFQQSTDAGSNGHSRYATTMRSHIHPHLSSPSSGGGGGGGGFNATLMGDDPQSRFSFSRLLPSHIPASGPAGAIVAAILVALTSEHAYGLVRQGVRHVLERFVWRDSHEEMVVRRREWRIRVESVRARADEQQRSSSAAAAEGGAALQGGLASQADDDGFWTHDRDVGPDIIRNSGKVE